MWFVNIFFQSVACLFILLIVCLNEDKSQILIKFTLSFFMLYACQIIIAE